MADSKFCTVCGAKNPQGLLFCTSCGSRFGTGLPPPAVPAAEPVQAPPPVNALPPPVTLSGLLQVILENTARNFPAMVRGLVKGMVIAFALVLFLNAFLQVTSLSGDDIPKMIIAASGLGSSPHALLFWTLFSAILAFFWSQLTGLGIRGLLGRCRTLPGWFGSSAATAGVAALPLVMAGAGAALLVRFFLLTTATDILLFIVMTGILFSQQHSLSILAMSLGWSDLRRVIKRTGPSIPAPGFAVVCVTGAFLGFLAGLFVPDTLLLISAVAVLFLVGLAVTWYRRRPASAGTPVTGGGMR